MANEKKTDQIAEFLEAVEKYEKGDETAFDNIEFELDRDPGEDLKQN